MDDADYFKRPADSGRVFCRRVEILDDDLLLVATLPESAYLTIVEDAQAMGQSVEERVGRLAMRELGRRYSSASIMPMWSKKSSRSPT